MNRIERRFLELRRRKKKALIVFMTAGDPSLAQNERLALAFEKEGVDLIELGVPFSDPLADGPVIQQSSQRSLRRGTTLARVLALVKKIRKKSQIPLLLMSYLNPVLKYGVGRFAREARRSGVDGLIVPDLPPEEGRELSLAMKKNGLDLVYLLAPTSGEKRKALVSRASRGFVYYVSLTGVTGLRKSLPAAAQRNIRLIKRKTKLPVCVGFGVSTPGQARTMAKVSDGVIIGSAVVRALSLHPALSAAQFSRKFIRPFAAALGKRP